MTMKSFFSREKGVGILYDDIFLVNGVRTPFGKFCGTLATISPTDLGVYACRGALEKSKVKPDQIDQVVIANIGQASGDAYFVARHIGLYSGVPNIVPALMVQRICASGLETIVTGAEQITLQKAASVLCCGSENMSLAPTVSFGNRLGYPLGRVDFKDMLWVALDDTAAGCPMGNTAENLAVKYKISRQEVDEFAKLSQDRATAATKNGFFDNEITPISKMTFEADGLKPRVVKLSGKIENFKIDENIRATNMDNLSKLPAVFAKEGVQTAGNSSGIVDGAASVIVASKEFIERNDLRTLSKVVGAASCGVDPKYMGIGPVPAIRLLLEMTGLTIDDIDLIEINEAFGAQVIACERELNINRDKLNINGGAIALGHPLAATGTRLALTMSRAMLEKRVKYGIASACIGGGQGTAVLFENTNVK